MIKKLIPDYYFKSVYDIPYEQLYEQGIRLILTDMDNTLISYKQTSPDEKLFKLKERILNIGFEFILVSNSRKKRVDYFAKAYDIPYVKFALKPLKRGIKKAIKLAKGKYNKNEILILGDQLMTDTYAGKRCKLVVGLVEAVDKKTDIGPTRFNRRLERFFLKRIKKKMPEEYDKYLKSYGENII
ncbi:MAG: hypothetical protein K6E20_00555 [Acholeplasmatales bacterium]|nr:hypothetical protein [Acholeplasmatales bacterium]